LDIRRTLSSGQGGTENFDSNLGLPQSGAETCLGSAWGGRHGEVREVQIVGSSDIAEGVHQHDSGKTRAVLGGGFDFGLVLFVDFRAQQGSGLFEFLDSFLQWGCGNRRNILAEVWTCAPPLATTDCGGTDAGGVVSNGRGVATAAVFSRRLRVSFNSWRSSCISARD
jgi:hypothetical protein